MSTGSGGGGRSLSTLSEINVTPLVDVMLVLLIVFMISAPLMQQGIQVNLPKANAGAMTETPEQLVLVINRSREIFLADHSVPMASLLAKLTAIAAAKPQIQIVIQADQGVSYGYVAQIMADVKRAGINQVGLVTDPTPNTKK